MTRDQVAQLAASLRDNEVFQQALSNTRNEALEGLATVARGDVDKICDYQATIRVVDSLRADLDRFIRTAAPRQPAGIA